MKEKTKKIFFMRSRTRSLTRWGAISILAALCILGMTVTDDPVEALPQGSEAVYRVDDAPKVVSFPELAYYVDKGRNVFSFSQPPRPKSAEPKEKPKPVKLAPPKPVKPVEPPKPTLNLSGLKLVGVIARPDGEGWAIVAGAGKHDVVVKRNDKVRGATVETIKPDRIVLEKDKLRQELVLASNIKAYHPKSRVKRKKKVETSAKTPVKKTVVGGRRRSLGFSVRIDRAGRGLQVTRVQRPDIDVQYGDILQAVDGESVTSLAKARDVLAAAKKKDSVTLSLLRNGRNVSVTVSMVE